MRLFSWRRPELDAVMAEEAADLLVGDPDPILYSDRLDSLEMEACDVRAILTPPLKPRRGSWHVPCPICGLEFFDTDTIRRVRYADGTRPYVHAWHLEKRQESPEECRHGLAPETCSWCNGTDQAVSFPLSRSFPARRAGQCIVCKERFARQTVIVKVSTPTGIGWAHGFHRSE